MKNKFLLLMLLCKITIAQTNLVPNPSFEQITHCPLGQSDFSASGWFTTDINNQGSPDLYNTCNTNTFASIPQNYKGYQFARTGSSYCGIVSYIDFPPYILSYARKAREYIEIHLTDTLQRKNKYAISFYVSLSDSSTLAVSKMGAYLSDTIVSFAQDSTLLFTPQVENPLGNYLTNKISWVKIEGNYTAHGGEQYIIIGTYASLASIASDTISVSAQNPYYKMAYYYIDDVSVTLADSTNGIDDVYLKNKIKVWPNPAINTFYIDVKDEPYFKGQLEIYDVLSHLVYSSALNNQHTQISSASLSNGVYYYKIKNDVAVVSQGKLVIAK